MTTLDSTFAIAAIDSSIAGHLEALRNAPDIDERYRYALIIISLFDVRKKITDGPPKLSPEEEHRIVMENLRCELECKRA